MPFEVIVGSKYQKHPNNKSAPKGYFYDDPFKNHQAILLRNNPPWCVVRGRGVLRPLDHQRLVSEVMVAVGGGPRDVPLMTQSEDTLCCESLRKTRKKGRSRLNRGY